ncbi:MAG TPA: type II toxin-antitoxin system antitoxin, RelB/DinJ family [Clostridiales bacterium]|mgnify:CR=1 FL=1|nr:type II toxin-antitoxin system antitoxin, RelB/DinJ family [Clostridiales bacterium]
MAQITFNVQIDENLKRQFEAVCANIGINPSDVINAFARAVVREGKIPFEIAALEKELSREADESL